MAARGPTVVARVHMRAAQDATCERGHCRRQPARVFVVTAMAGVQIRVRVCCAAMVLSSSSRLIHVLF